MHVPSIKSLPSQQNLALITSLDLRPIDGKYIGGKGAC